ncbi:hypothetical protein OAF30_04940 [Flavobacteriales bacterium]|nr:hypothetical protein [Flavobacteriales bacterium]
MPIYRYNGTILYRHGGIAFHERCCCDDECDCPNCPVCPYCCIDWGYFELDWTYCNCFNLSFVHAPAGGLHSECHPASDTNCGDDKKGRYWTAPCVYELPGYWLCYSDPDNIGISARQFVGCGIIRVEIVSATEINVTVLLGPPPGDCLLGDPDCDQEIGETVTIDLPNITDGSVSSICDGTNTPARAVAGDGLSSTNNCIGEVRFEWTLTPCCPEITTDCDEISSGGGGGGDPTGCCDDGYGNFTTTTAANCQGSWSSSPCDEGYP